MTFTKLTPEQLRLHKGLSFTGISTVFFCHDGQGNIFLAQRSNQARDEQGHWDPGAGGVKHGQSIDQTLRRELLEEYAVEPLETQFLGYQDVFRKNHEGLATHWLAMFFAIKVDRHKLKINEPDKVQDSGWFTLDTLPNQMHSQLEAFMEQYGSDLRAILARG